jgi:signal transduction histidine kinase
VAKGIVQAHGGRIWAESPGHDEERCPGAEFHVLLPVEQPARKTQPGIGSAG